MRIDGPQVTSSLSLNGTTITDLNVFVTTASFNGLTGSYATTGSNLFKGTQTLSGSILPSVNNTYDLGSPTQQFRHVYISSGSLYVNGTKVLGSTSQELQITTDGGQSFKILESGSDTITLQSVDGNVTLTSSGQGDIVLDPTTGIIGLKGTITVYTGNKITSSDGNSIQFGNGIAVTGSIVSTVTPLVSGSSQVLNGSGVWSGSAQLPSGIISGSAQLPSGIVSSSLQVTGYGFATTGSNAFVGTQTITGSLYISSDLVVQGSSSLQDITASAVNIGANIINLNTANPAIRFAGLNIFDSGSIGGSGSFLYDAVQDEFIFVHRGDGTNITSSVTLMGPQTYNNIGSEIYPTTNRLLKGTGNEHVGDSIVSETEGGIGISGSLSITGSIIATGTDLVSGSVQITYSGLTGIPSGIISGSAQVVSLLPSGTVSGSAQILNGTGFVKTSGASITYDNSTYLTAESDTLSSVTARGASTSTALSLGQVSTSSRLSVGATDQSYASVFVSGDITAGVNQYAIITDPQLSGTSNSYALFANARIKGNTAVTNTFGVYIPSAEKLSGASIVNNYALYIANQTAGSTTNYSIYSSGGLNYLGGATTFNSSVRAASLSMNTAPSADRVLYLSANLPTTGTSQFQAVMNGTFVNAATTLYGVYVGNNSNVNVTNSYALFLESTGGSGTITNKYGVYQSGGSDKNYFAGSVGVNNPNPSLNLDVDGTSRTTSTAMIGSSVGLLQFAMDGTRFNSYGFSHVHIKTSILKGSDTMISFNLRGYYYSPNTIDTDVAFYNYNPVSYVYGVTQHVKAAGGITITMYYSSDNYVCICVEGLGTYGGFALNWINTSLIQWGGRVFTLAWSRVNTASAQY